MSLARHWRLRDQRYRLEGTACDDCGTIQFPPRPLCPNCRSRTLSPHPLNGRGQLISYTVLYQAPAGFEAQIPYAVGIVELGEGPRLTAMLTDVDLDALQIGMSLEMTIRKLRSDGDDGVIQYGYKFRPVQFEGA